MTQEARDSTSSALPWGCEIQEYCGPGRSTREIQSQAELSLLWNFLYAQEGRVSSVQSELESHCPKGGGIRTINTVCSFRVCSGDLVCLIGFEGRGALIGLGEGVVPA